MLAAAFFWNAVNKLELVCTVVHKPLHARHVFNRFRRDPFIQILSFWVFDKLCPVKAAIANHGKHFVRRHASLFCRTLDFSFVNVIL
ncbi:MAG: hypothetical protein EB833_02070 [Thaumarchaeota archaeon S13]|nr:MAG: hypothetical protein EB833_02070 [Thaumarchaeota archaeon S13]